MIFNTRTNLLPSIWAARVSLALVAVTWLSAQETHRLGPPVFTHERDVQTTPWYHFPRWDGSLLVGREHNESNGPVIFTIDSEGLRDETPFTLKDAGYINIIDAAASSSGEIAAVGSALVGDRATTFVALIAADRRSQVVTRVWPYCAMVVTFAADGNIWTIGHVKDDDNTRAIALHVLRRFDPSGKLLTSTAIVTPGRGTDEISYLRSSSDRVGWFNRSAEYIEFALDGSEIGRYAGPSGLTERDISGVALSPENQVVAGTVADGKAQFLVLDRQNRRWIPASVAPEFTSFWARVLGFDGTTLVITDTNARLRRFITK